MPELRGPRRWHGGQKSEPGARVKAEAAKGGGAKAPALRRATGSDMIKASKSTLTDKTVAHFLRTARRRFPERTGRELAEVTGLSIDGELGTG